MRFSILPAAFFENKAGQQNEAVSWKRDSLALNDDAVVSFPNGGRARFHTNLDNHPRCGEQLSVLLPCKLFRQSGFGVNEVYTKSKGQPIDKRRVLQG